MLTPSMLHLKLFARLPFRPLALAKAIIRRQVLAQSVEPVAQSPMNPSQAQNHAKLGWEVPRKAWHMSNGMACCGVVQKHLTAPSSKSSVLQNLKASCLMRAGFITVFLYLSGVSTTTVLQVLFFALAIVTVLEWHRITHPQGW
jgi:hypothetical protein